jgi:hypothetical protein
MKHAGWAILKGGHFVPPFWTMEKVMDAGIRGVVRWASYV